VDHAGEVLNEMAVNARIDRMLAAAGVHAHFAANLAQDRGNNAGPQTSQHQSAEEKGERKFQAE
jgi:hypothetical protein